MRRFIGGFVVASVVWIAGAMWLVHKIESQPVMFPSKSVYDGGDFYHFEGSVYGDDADAPINNLISAWCYRSRMECEIITQNEITGAGLGPFVSSPDSETIKVRSWRDREIIADSQGLDPRQCNWYEIRANRQTEEVAYDRIPNKNPAYDLCKGVTPKVMHWRIDNGKAHTQNADGSSREKS